MNKEAWRKKIKERIDSGIKGNHITAPEGMDLHKYGFALLNLT